MNLLKVESGSVLEESGLPSQVDWRDFLTPVKNQGACGSCWAFGTVEQVKFRDLLFSATPVLVLFGFMHFDKFTLALKIETRGNALLVYF